MIVLAIVFPIADGTDFKSASIGERLAAAAGATKWQLDGKAIRTRGSVIERVLRTKIVVWSVG